MDKSSRDALRQAVVDARNLLERDYYEQLEGTYGIWPDGQVKPIEGLTHLTPAGRARRQAIVSAITHEQSENNASQDAIARYARESAFTALNRLAGLKLMEAENRKLIRPSLGAYRDSSGFREFAQISPQLCMTHPDGGYRFYLELLYDDLAHDLGVLFDRDLPQAILFPSETCLRDVLDILNAQVPTTIWSEDETIGWIYQFFTPKQLRDQARKDSAAPRDSYELAFRNQFFTPRYVVEFLVDNTLGRLWWEMRRGNTALVERCRYLIRPPDQPIPQRDKVDPRTIRALDPASGSGHFLLYGFDLFEAIYLEAYTDPDLGPALQHDYPSFDDFKRALPCLILKHNLHGIDIDLRAAQIAALALWLRAQRSYQQSGLKVRDRPIIRRVNVVAAEPMPGEADLLEEFLATLDNPVIRDLVRKMWMAMKSADEIGSLLQVERTLREEIRVAKHEWSGLPPMIQLQLFGPAEPQPRQLTMDMSFVKDETFWERVEGQVLEQLRTYAQRSANGRAYARKLFADDAERGFAFIDLLSEPFDVVWMNPPFGAASAGAKAYIDGHYPLTKNDLYAAFVERGLQVLNPRGLLGAITSRTGFFLTSFRHWREEILIPKTRIHAVADLGYGVLDSAMVETAAYVVEKQKDENFQGNGV
jgi:hypothetical protein